MFFDYCNCMIRQHPAYSVAYHIPNEGRCSVQRRVALKRAGLRKGMPDICVPVGCGKYHALYIEMKIKPNKPSPEQLEIIKLLNANGNYACICWSGDEAVKVLQNYIAEKL